MKKPGTDKAVCQLPTNDYHREKWVSLPFAKGREQGTHALYSYTLWGREGVALSRVAPRQRALVRSVNRGAGALLFGAGIIELQ
jgi:hypothetical protein